MKCPIDGATLTMSERSGVEIDYCPDCRGVWLDRGELDKILERVAGDAPGAPAGGYQQRGYQGGTPGGGDSPGGHYQGSRRPKKKEHWLTELFD